MSLPASLVISLNARDAYQGTFSLLPALPSYSGLCPDCGQAFSYEQHGLDGNLPGYAHVAADRCYTCKTIRPHTFPTYARASKVDATIWREDFESNCYRAVG